MAARSRPTPRSARLSTGAAIGVVLACLVALIVLVAWGTRGPGAGELDAPASALPSGAPAEPAPLAGALDGERSTELLGPASWREAELGVAAGVRLPGPGWLGGRVVDRGSGAGVPDARVDLLSVPPVAAEFLGDMLRLARVSEDMERRTLPIAVTRSGPDGSFRFDGVRVGAYYLDARGPHHACDAPLTARVTEEGGESAEGPVVLWMRAGGRVLGRVVRADGRPAARASVTLLPGPGAIVRSFRQGDLRRHDVRADADGRFVIAGVAPDEGYEVHAVGHGLAVTHVALPPVVAGTDLEVEIVGRRPAELRGRVLGRADPDAAPTPLAGAELGVVPQGMRDMPFFEEILRDTWARTDADGRYRIPNVPPGELEVLAVHPGYVGGRSVFLDVPESHAGPRDGGPTEVPDLVLDTGPLLRGRVVDAAGAPVDGVHVRWFTSEVPPPGSFDFSFATLLHQAIGDFEFPTTDADGRFVAGPFPGEPPFAVYCARSGYEYHRALWDPAKDGPELVIVLSAGGTVEGIVVDLARARPVPAFFVGGADRIDRRFDEPSPFAPVSGEELVEHPEGRFLLEGIRAGRSSLTFHAPGYQPETVEIDVSEGETSRGVIVRLSPGGDVSGVVVDAAGEPVAGAQVAVLGGGSWSLERTFDRLESHFRSGFYTDTAAEVVTNRFVSFATRMGSLGDGAALSGPDGAFRLGGVAPGGLAVLARHRDYALGQSEPLELGSGDSIEGVRVVLTQGAGLFGRVTDRFDRPLSGAFVLALSPSEYSGDRSAEAATYQGIADAEGRYEIAHMAGGGYLVAVTRADDSLRPMSLAATLQFDLVNVPEGQRVRYDIVDRSAAGCRVTGSILGAEEGLPRGGLVAMSFEGENLLGLDVKAARVAPDGTYEFPGLAPGDYQFLFQGGEAELRWNVLVPDLPEARLDLALPRGRIAGRLVDAATGEGIAGGRIECRRTDVGQADSLLSMFLYRRGEGLGAASGPDGRFVFPRLQGGTYELRAWPPEARADELSPSSPAPARLSGDEDELEVELALRPSLALAGRVVDDAGLAVEGARVLAYVDVRGAPLDATASEADGSFRLAPLPAGAYTVVASRDGHAEGVLEGVELAPGSPPGSADGLVVALPRGAPVDLRVFGPDGRPVSGAVATAFAESGRAVASTLEPGGGFVDWFAGETGTDADGRSSLGLLAPGRYRLEVQRGGWRGEVDPLEVGEQPLEVEVRLR